MLGIVLDDQPYEPNGGLEEANTNQWTDRDYIQRD